MAFIQASGLNFTLSGKKWTLFGGSVYDVTAGDFSRATVDDKIVQALYLNLNTIRIVNYIWHSLGWNSETVWAHVDYIFQQCRSNHLKVIFDLSDLSYFAKLSSGLELTNAATIAYYYQYIDWIFARVNTLNSIPYKDDDVIAVISIAGEVENDAPNDGQRLHDFYLATSARIKQTGAQQLVHAGGQKPHYLVNSQFEHSNHIGDGQSMLDIPTIDCISVHSYDTYDDWLNYYPTTLAYCQSLQKPWFIEEFGYNQTTVKNDQARSEKMMLAYKTGLIYGSAGFSLWNLDRGWYNPQTDSGGGYGVSSNTPLTAAIVQKYSKFNGYSPRTPVDSVNPQIV